MCHSDHIFTFKVLLLLDIKLASTLLQNLLNLLTLNPHILWIDVASAHWALIFIVELIDDAALMECVAHVTSKWSNLVPILEIREADDTVCDAPEAARVVGNFGRLVNHTLSRFSLPVFICAMRAIRINDAWAENGGNCDSTHYNEGLGEDEADDDGEDGETEAGIWVVAMRGEAVECIQDVDGPGSVQDSRHCFQYENSLRHYILVICCEEKLNQESKDSFRDDTCVEEGHVEHGRLKLTAFVHHWQCKQASQAGCSKTALFKQLVLVLLLKSFRRRHSRSLFTDSRYMSWDGIDIIVWWSCSTICSIMIIVSIGLVIVALTCLVVVIVAVEAFHPASVGRLLRRGLITTLPSRS